MPDVRSFDIPPLSAKTFTVERGKIARITDVAGGQPGDLVAFNVHDLWQRFSQSRTRVENRTVRVTAGHVLYANTLPPAALLTIVEDTAGGHDLLYTPCCRYALETRFATSRDGCFEHLAAVLEPWKIAPLDIPDPLNLFFAVCVEPDGTLGIAPSPSRPGDHISLRAEMDLLLAVSTCAVPRPGVANSGYQVEIYRP